MRLSRVWRLFRPVDSLKKEELIVARKLSLNLCDDYLFSAENNVYDESQPLSTLEDTIANYNKRVPNLKFVNYDDGFLDMIQQQEDMTLTDASFITTQEDDMMMSHNWPGHNNRMMSGGCFGDTTHTKISIATSHLDEEEEKSQITFNCVNFFSWQKYTDTRKGDKLSMARILLAQCPCHCHL